MYLCLNQNIIYTVIDFNINHYPPPPFFKHFFSTSYIWIAISLILLQVTLTESLLSEFQLTVYTVYYTVLPSWWDGWLLYGWIWIWILVRTRMFCSPPPVLSCWGVMMAIHWIPLHKWLSESVSDPLANASTAPFDKKKSLL